MCKFRFAAIGFALAVGLFFGGQGWSSSDAANAAFRPRPAGEKERHPHIHRAITELREAKKELLTADHDFGGHRAEAVEAVTIALKQLETALKYDKR
ncbi:MAG TPA: hypothetical protein VK395_07800 [Gemmataceae bacterium]|nr:hypothetical protein [Gemmataceae bacterium]